MPDPAAAPGTPALLGPTPRLSPVSTLWVRPPRPLSLPVRIALAMGAVVLVAGGAVALRSASVDDERAGIDGSTLDQLLPPAGAELDGFDHDGGLAATDAVPWTVAAGAWTTTDGHLRPTAAGESRTLVDVGSVDALIDVKVVRAQPGAGIVVAQGPADHVELLATDSGDGWELVRTTGATRTLVQLVPGPVADTALQVVRHPDRVVVSFDRNETEIALPGGPLAASTTAAGLVSAGPGRLIVDHFADLPLDPP